MDPNHQPEGSRSNRGGQDGCCCWRCLTGRCPSGRGEGGHLTTLWSLSFFLSPLRKYERYTVDWSAVHSVDGEEWWAQHTSLWGTCAHCLSGGEQDCLCSVWEKLFDPGTDDGGGVLVWTGQNVRIVGWGGVYREHPGLGVFVLQVAPHLVEGDENGVLSRSVSLWGGPTGLGTWLMMGECNWLVVMEAGCVRVLAVADQSRRDAVIMGFKVFSAHVLIGLNCRIK